MYTDNPKVSVQPYKARLHIVNTTCHSLVTSLGKKHTVPMSYLTHWEHLSPRRRLFCLFSNRNKSKLEDL